MSGLTKASRLSCDERREAIVQAVKSVFAKKGFDGTTTKELAKAAGVSEALIFRHFPNKESLFDAMSSACAKAAEDPEFKRIMSLDPSTSTLVFLTHFLISKFLREHSSTGEEVIKYRLIARSLLEDGEFAKVISERFA